MRLLKKKESNFIDFTLLEKKGIIKKYLEDEANKKIDAAAQKTPGLESPFSFLDSIASASKSEPPAINEGNQDINAIKIKIDDMEYKLERFLEKLTLIESKLKDFERKSANFNK